MLRLRGITKRFPGALALDRVSLDLYRGETLALLGENGAGKSSLIRVLAGAHQPNEGEIELFGQSTELPTPRIANSKGISVIHQEFNLLPMLTAAENIFLGHERARLNVVKRAEEHRVARTLFDRLGAEIAPDALCGRLTVAQQQLVEIAKALSLDSKIIVMDEPSATLTDSETSRLLKTITELNESGISVIYISHRLDEVERIANRAVILRDGRVVGEIEPQKTSRKDLIQLMVGRELEQEYPQAHDKNVGRTVLKATHLRRSPIVNDVSLELREGEIVALTGLIGSGRTETARVLFGADQAERGTMELNGEPFRPGSPRAAIKRGVALLTEDRKHQGLILSHSIQDNFGLPNLEFFSKLGVVRRTEEHNAFSKYATRLPIKFPRPTAPAKTLSGGNQQKVVLSKWLEREAKLLIFDEPTRGIDVGAKYEIYMLMRELASQGKALLMITSELPEALGMADRLLIMRSGRIVREISDPRSVKQEEILAFALEPDSSVEVDA